MRSSSGSYAVLLALAAHAQAASGAGPQRFDLICTYHGRVVADPHPRSRGTYPANEPTWHGSLRYVVDLRKAQFCDVRFCISYGIHRLAGANVSRITFYNQQGSRSRNWLFESVRNRDGYYLHRTGDEEGYMRESAGTCRRAPFSGFPPRQAGRR
jgi:hypothetical protein